MLAEQRYQEILNILERDGTVKASDLCSILNSSRETIRRDLETLSDRGQLRRIHGGAMQMHSQQSLGSQYTAFAERKKANPNAKEAIARAAADHIQDGQSIALDAGTTSLALAKAIKNRFHSLTVVTNSLAVANELAHCPGITLLMTGGVFRADEEAFVPDNTALNFSKINVDVFFLTVCGISVERGITYQRMDEVVVQRAIMEAAEQVVVIADSSKLGVSSLVTMCAVEEISAVITDSNASAEQVEAFREAGVNVILSKEEK